MTTSTFAERVMLRDVERIADAPHRDVVLLAAEWRAGTAQELIYAMRFGTTPGTGSDVTADELACAMDAVDSLVEARLYELGDDLMHGTHWAHSRCWRCAA